jgi:uncharacterized protein (TIGR03435 family)
MPLKYLCVHCASAVLVVLSVGSLAQQAAAPANSDQTNVTAFEVASIHLNAPGSIGDLYVSPSGLNRYMARHISLLLLIGMAYGIPQKHIHYGPSWVESQTYDIEAKAPGDLLMTALQKQAMIKQLLKARFQVALHSETVLVPGYSLIVDKGGPKLQASTTKGMGLIEPNGFHFYNQSLKDLAKVLERVTGRPVADNTQLEGNYDVELSYSAVDDQESNLPSVYTALQEHLGLKLVPQKVPVDEITVDHIERVPSSN